MHEGRKEGRKDVRPKSEKRVQGGQGVQRMTITSICAEHQIVHVLPLSAPYHAGLKTPAQDQRRCRLGCDSHRYYKVDYT